MTFWKFLIAALCVNIGARASARKRSATCLPELDRDPELFARCSSVPCLLFKESRPFIIFGPRPHPRFGRPFRCHSRKAEYKHLHGVSFHVLDQIPELQNATCIALSDGCTYDDLTYTLEDMSARKLIAMTIDFLALAEYRLTNTTTSSVLWLQGKMEVYGLRKNAQVRLSEGVGIVISIYEPRAWLLIALWFLLLVFLRLLIILTFQAHNFIRGTRLRTLFRYLVFANREYRPSDVNPDELENYIEEEYGFEYWSKVWGYLWLTSLAIIVALVEIVIAVKIFNPNWNKLEMPLHSMPKSRLREFCTTNGTANQYFFELLADLNEKFSTTNSRPYQVSSNHTECVAKIRDPDNAVKFGLRYDFDLRGWLRSEDGCGEFAVFQVRTEQPRYNGVWYFNKFVSDGLKLAIDRRLISLRETSRISKEVTAVTGEDLCGETSNAVSVWVLLGLLMFVIPGVLFLILGISRPWWFRMREFRNRDRSS